MWKWTYPKYFESFKIIWPLILKTTRFCTKPRWICSLNLVKICERVCELCVMFHPDTQTNKRQTNKNLASNESASTHCGRVTQICIKNKSPLLQIMAWPLFGAKPLPEQMLTYCWLDPWEYVSINFQSRKRFWKSHLQIGGHFLSTSIS